jgi:hypothetical protein
VAFTERNVADLRAKNPGHAFLHPATSCYRDGPITSSELASIIEQVSACDTVANDKRVCLVFGRGSQTRGVYRELERTHGLEVLWQGPVMPWWLLPLALVAAAHGGLIRVTERTQAPQVMLRLAHLAAVELYSFRAELFPSVAQHVGQTRWRANIGHLVGNDPTYFTVGVDGDSHDAPTGIFAWVAYGAECPQDLKSAGATS